MVTSEDRERGPSRTSTRTKLVLIGVSATAGSLGSTWLAVVGSTPALIAIPFCVGGAVAVLCARHVVAEDSSPPRSARSIDPETEDARRKRHEDINAATTTLRSQVIYGLLGLTLLFVGAPAGILAAGGLYAAAFVVGIAFLALLWRHWRSAWKYHRTIPGMIGVSTTWPAGFLSPADRRFMASLVICAGIWYVSMTILAFAADSRGQAAIISTTLLIVGLPSMWRMSAMWMRRP